MCRQTKRSLADVFYFPFLIHHSLVSSKQYRILMNKRKQTSSARRANLNSARCNNFVAFIFTLSARACVYAKRLRIRMFRTQSERYVYVCIRQNTSNQFARFIIKCVRIVCVWIPLFFGVSRTDVCALAQSCRRQSNRRKKQQQYALWLYWATADVDVS